MEEDPIDRLAAQWAVARPDLDVTAMATIARLHRVSAVIRQDVDRRFEARGISTGEFDVLSALRRTHPTAVKPSELARLTMLSPSGMTSRVDRLAAAGLVERITDPENLRIAPVQLTEAGVAVADDLITVHTAAMHERLSMLAPEQRRDLDAVLRALDRAE